MVSLNRFRFPTFSKLLVRMCLANSIHSPTYATTQCRDALKTSNQNFTSIRLSAEQKKMITRLADLSDVSPSGSFAVLSLPHSSFSNLIFSEYLSRLLEVGYSTENIVRLKPSTPDELVNLFEAIKNNHFSTPDKILWIEAPYTEVDDLMNEKTVGVDSTPSIGPSKSKGPWFKAWMNSYNKLNKFEGGGPALPAKFMVLITPNNLTGSDLREAALDFHTKTMLSTTLPE